MRIVDRWWQRRRYETLPLLVSASLVLGYSIWAGMKIASWTTERKRHPQETRSREDAGLIGRLRALKCIASTWKA